MLQRVNADIDDTTLSLAAAEPATAAVAAPATLEAFLDAISPRAFRFAELGLRHREDALDAVQDAMVKMLGYRDRPAPEWTPLFWSILRSRIVDAQRRRSFRLSWLRTGSVAGSRDGVRSDQSKPSSSFPDCGRSHDRRKLRRRCASTMRLRRMLQNNGVHSGAGRSR